MPHVCLYFVQGCAGFDGVGGEGVAQDVTWPVGHAGFAVQCGELAEGEAVGDALCGDAGGWRAEVVEPGA